RHRAGQGKGRGLSRGALKANRQPGTALVGVEKIPLSVDHQRQASRSRIRLRVVEQIDRRQSKLLKSSRSSGEKWLYRPVSISLFRAKGGISRKDRSALCTSGRSVGLCCVVGCAIR